MYGHVIDLCARLFAKKKIQSCYVEPAKSDIPASNFKKFVYDKYKVQLNQFVNSFEDQPKIPDGWVWTPDNVDEGRSNDKYMKMGVILLAVMCLHFQYGRMLGINVYDRVLRIMMWQMYNDIVDNEIKVIHTKPITARLIKYMQYNHGAGNAAKITVGDYGFTKPYWRNPHTGSSEQYNQYGRLRGVK